MLTPERNITPAFRRLLKRTFPAVGTLFTEWAAKSQIKFIFDVRDAPWHTDKKDPATGPVIG